MMSVFEFEFSHTYIPGVGNIGDVRCFGGYSEY